VPTKNLKSLVAYVRPEVYEELKRFAEKEGRSASNLVAKIVSDWVQRQSRQGGAGDE
jgi:hypothetical protein